MFKDHHPKHVTDKWKHESTEEALARGVTIQKVGVKVSGKKKQHDKPIEKHLIPVELRDLIK